MAARRPDESGAGPWVAWLNDGRRSYVRREGYGWTSDIADALRFDTKAEALSAVRQGRRRQPYVTTGASKVAAGGEA